MINHRRIYRKKCSTVSVVVAAIAIRSWAGAYTKVHYCPQAMEFSHRLMMSSIQSHPEIETNVQKNIGEKSWKDDVVNSNPEYNRHEAYTTTARKPPLDFFSAMFGNDAATSVSTTISASAAEIKMQPEMWDFIQAGLAPYYEAVYGLQETVKFKFSIASSQSQIPLNKRILKVRQILYGYSSIL
jgi:hypothetical protein